jgi:hypothetical protein
MNATTMKRTTTRRPLLIVAALVVALGAGLYFSGIWPVDARIIHDTISQPVGEATRADVSMTLDLGRLRLGALDQQPGNLIAGDIAHREQRPVVQTFAVSGDTATFTLRQQGGSATSMIKQGDDAVLWDLRLNPATPIHLVIETGAGEGAIDLTELQITDLDFKTGVGTTTLTLPRAGQVRARVSSDVGNMTIRVPTGVAVRIEASAGLGDIDVSGNYRRQGDSYVSPDFDSAANRIELHASSGIGSITIQPVSE